MGKVDYDFMKKVETTKNGRVEVMDIDLPARNYTGGKTSIEQVRHKMIEGDQRISKMKKEVDELAIIDENSFANAEEMKGQTKKLKKALEDAVNLIIKPLWDEWKSGRNILTDRTDKLDKILEALKTKTDSYAHKLKMQQLEDDRKAREAADKIQADIDKKQEAAAAAERKAARAAKREPVIEDRIIIDVPVAPKTLKFKTASSSTTIKSVLVPVITDMESEYVLQTVLLYKRKHYEEIAYKAIKKALDGGVLGLKGADGVQVDERYISDNRRR